MNIPNNMKNTLSFLFIITFTFLSFQVKAQQVIASAGGYYEGDNISISWTLGEPVTETFSGGGVILTQGFQQPYNFYLQQILNIPAGWSGVSSYINPMNKGVEGIFAPYSADFIILASMTQFYYPEAGVNTIGIWDYHTGYKIKAENEFDVTLTGLKPASQTLQLAQGWNLLPVLSQANVDVAALFSSVNLVIAKEVAGNKLYWPQFGINTLGYLAPGKAYFVLLSSAGVVDFSGFKTSQVKMENLSVSPDLTAFNIHPTPITHNIAILPEASEEIEPGNLIGAFDQSGNCFGIAFCESETFGLTIFGDDPMTVEKDGFEEGEMMCFKVFNPDQTLSGLKTLTDLYPIFDTSLPQADGTFAENGLSAIKSLKTTGINDFGESPISVSVFPNPSTSVFNIKLSEINEDAEWEVVSVHGASILSGEIQQNLFTIDLSTQPKGIYYLKIKQDGLQLVRKLVLQ